MRSLTVPKLGVNSQQAADLSTEPAQHWVNASGPGCATRPAQPHPDRGASPRNAHPMPADRQGDSCGPEWARADGGLPQPRPGYPSAHPVRPVHPRTRERGGWSSAPPAASPSTLQPPPPVLPPWLTHAPPPHHASNPQTQLQWLPQHRLSCQSLYEPPGGGGAQTLTLAHGNMHLSTFSEWWDKSIAGDILYESKKRDRRRGNQPEYIPSLWLSGVVFERGVVLMPFLKDLSSFFCFQHVTQ